MGWLRLVGSLKLYVSFAEYCLFYRALWQKRPVLLRSLLIVATPYVYLFPYSYAHSPMYIPRYFHILYILLSIFIVVCIYFPIPMHTAPLYLIPNFYAHSPMYIPKYFHILYILLSIIIVVRIYFRIPMHIAPCMYQDISYSVYIAIDLYRCVYLFPHSYAHSPIYTPTYFTIWKYMETYTIFIHQYISTIWKYTQ